MNSLFENEDGSPRKLGKDEKEYLEMILGKMIKDLQTFGSFKSFITSMYYETNKQNNNYKLN